MSAINDPSIASQITEIKGNPLDEHPELYTLLRKHFAEIEEKFRNAEDPCSWVDQLNSWFWTEDYRVVRVYNLTHFLNLGQTDNLFRR